MFRSLNRRPQLLLRLSSAQKTAQRTPTARQLTTDTEMYGKFTFRGSTADGYLQQQGLPAGTMESHAWTRTADKEKVAAAILQWAQDMGASSYCHWFQPLGSSILRHGMSGQVHNCMVEFDPVTKEPVWRFGAKQLMRGETDGSSYNTGGLRATHTAGGYTCLDPSSPPFIRGDTVFLPACLVSFNGEALDEKTPLLRALDAVSTHGAGLLNRLGFQPTAGAAGCSLEVEAHIGLEQEFFLVSREAYLTRPDIQLCGRSVLGRRPPRGQEANDHYMSPISEASPAMAVIQEVQDECYRLGIPLRTRHREVAPNQYEVVALFGKVTAQVDHNVILSQILEEVSVRHNLAALLHEKPFEGVNGSGKHNNWSLRSNCGANLFDFQDMHARTGSNVAFAVTMAAVVQAIDRFGALMRLAIAAPGNEFRLGACEAPPAIMSMYLGDELTRFLDDFRCAADPAVVAPFREASKELELGSRVLAPISIPAQDRNRTSPFPFISDRFEFRSVGSSQNVSMVNTVLASAMAHSFKEFSAKIDAGAAPAAVAQEALNKHWKVVFNGDSYSAAEQARLTAEGLCNISSTLEALKQYTAEENMSLFEELGVFTREECRARQDVGMDNYVQVVEIEAECMMDMITQQIIPALQRAAGEQSATKGSDAFGGIIADLEGGISFMKDSMAAMHAEGDLTNKMALSQRLRLEIMSEVREVCSRAEKVCPLDLWPMATYRDLLFLDQSHHTSHEPSHK